MAGILGRALPYVFLGLWCSSNAFAEDTPALQSYESCSLITSEYLTILQLFGRGLDADVLTETLPDISAAAAKRTKALVSLARERGILEAYSTVYSEYAACAKSVYQRRGIPEAGTREAHFYRCAGENKIGYEISLAAIIGAKESEVLEQIPENRHKASHVLFELQRSEGNEALLDNLATDLKHCLNQDM